MPLDYSHMTLPKPSRKKQKKPTQRTAYSLADERDHNRCQHPGCTKRKTNHHHIIFRSQGGKNEVENLVCLCEDHHKLSNDSPHQSEKWRRYWERWSKQRYPKYWKVRERV